MFRKIYGADCASDEVAAVVFISVLVAVPSGVVEAVVSTLDVGVVGGVDGIKAGSALVKPPLGRLSTCTGTATVIG